MSTDSATAKTIIPIDPTAPFEDNAVIVMEAVPGARYRRPDLLKDDIDSLTGVVSNFFQEMWSVCGHNLQLAGMSKERIEDIRRAVLLGAWIDVVGTIFSQTVIQIVDSKEKANVATGE